MHRVESWRVVFSRLTFWEAIAMILGVHHPALAVPDLDAALAAFWVVIDAGARLRRG